MTTRHERQPGPWFDVPAGTCPSECRAVVCRQTIYWIETPAGRRLCVDVEVPGGFAPTDRSDGRGIAHWATCAVRDAFRRGRQ